MEQIASIETCAATIEAIGGVDRQLAAIQSDLDKAVAQAKAVAEVEAAPLRERRDGMVIAVQTYCNANRAALIEGKKKSIAFATGEAGWRMGQPKLEVDPKREAAIVDWLFNDRKTKHLVRQKLSLKARAILDQPELVKGLKGLKILPAEESFWVKSTALDLADGPGARAAAE